MSGVNDGWGVGKTDSMRKMAEELGIGITNLTSSNAGSPKTDTVSGFPDLYQGCGMCKHWERTQLSPGYGLCKGASYYFTDPLECDPPASMFLDGGCCNVCDDVPQLYTLWTHYCGLFEMENDDAE